MMKQLIGLTVAAALVALHSPASAQIVNVQSLNSSNSGEDGFQGEVGGSLTLKTGNVDLLLANTSLLLSYRSGAHKLISSSSAQLGIKSGEDFLEKVFTHFRHQVIFTDWLTWEAYVQVATDRFKRLPLRALAGTGGRLTLVEGPAVALSVGLSYMFEREMLNETAFIDSGAVHNHHRLSTYVTGKFIIDPLISFNHTTYFQPRADDPLDFRLSSDTSLGFKLTDSLGVSIGFLVTYDTRPPEGVRDLDTATNARFSYGF